MAQAGSNTREFAVAKKNCPQCGEKVGPKARFCECCGHRLKGAPPAPRAPAAAAGESQALPEEVDTTQGYLNEFDAREAAQLSHEYFERHIEILASYRKRLKSMVKGLDRRERHLVELSEGELTEARHREIQKALESLEELGDEWEDLQLSYNQDSEVLDEEFQERFAEMEIDVELPEDLQERMNRELEVMMGAFDKVGQRIATVGALGNQLIGQATGRWFEGKKEARARQTLLWVSLLTGLVSFGVLFGALGAGLVVAGSAGGIAVIVPLLFVSRF